MATVNGNGVILSKGLDMLTFCTTNVRKFEFRNFYISDDSSNITYNDIISPTGTFNNSLAQELVASSSFSNVYGPEAVVDDGTRLSSTSSTEIPIVLPIPVNGIVSNSDLREIYVTARDSEVDVNLVVSDLTDFDDGDTVTGAISGATGVIVKTYDDTVAGKKRIYLKNVSTLSKFVVGETVNSAPGGGSDTISEIETPTVLKISGTSSPFSVDDDVVGITSGATGSVYLQSISGGYTYIYLIGVDGTFTAGENFWVTNQSSTITAISTVTDYAPEFVIYNSCFNYDNAADPATTGSIISLPYIANGTDLNIRITLEQIVGVVPTTYTFSDTRATEIYTHDADVSAHSDSLLSIQGTNSPEANINWGTYKITNLGDPTSDGDAVPYGFINSVGNASLAPTTLTELETYISELKYIDHDIEITIPDHSSIAGQEIEISEIAGTGTLTFTSSVSNSNLLRNIKVKNVSCDIFFEYIKLNGLGSANNAFLIEDCNYVNIDYCHFTNCGSSSSHYLCYAYYSSFVNFRYNTFLSGNNSGFYAVQGTVINVDKNIQSNEFSGYLYRVRYGGKISKQYFDGNSNYILSTSGTFSFIDGGILTGKNTTITETIDSSEISSFNDILNGLDKYIPATETITFNLATANVEAAGFNIDGFYGGGKIVINGYDSVSVIADPTDPFSFDTSFKSNDYFLNITNNSIEIFVGYINFISGSAMANSIYCENNDKNIEIDYCLVTTDGGSITEYHVECETCFDVYLFHCVFCDSYGIANAIASNISLSECDDYLTPSRTKGYRKTRSGEIYLYNTSLDGDTAGTNDSIYTTPSYS